MEGSFQIHHVDQDSTLQETKNTQNDYLREDVRGNAQVHHTFAAIDGSLLDDLTGSIDTAKKHGSKCHDKQERLGVRTRIGGDGLLQELLLAQVLLLHEGSPLGRVEQVNYALAVDRDNTPGIMDGVLAQGTISNAGWSECALSRQVIEDQGDNGCLQEQDQQIGDIVFDQVKVAPREKRKLSPGVRVPVGPVDYICSRIAGLLC